MKCQKCKAEIPDGKIYCENCGTAIQMVPDYNPAEDFTIETAEKSKDILLSVEGTPRMSQTLWSHLYHWKYRIGIIFLVILGIAVFQAAYHSVVRQKETVMEELEMPELLNRPQFSITPGKYDYSLEVKISHTDCTNGVIYYTTDGTTPDETSQIYRDPVTVNEGTTVIRAVFIRSDGVQSEEADGTYEVIFDYPAEPLFSVQGGSYTGSFRVTLTAEPDCKIYYTTNGEEPGLGSRLYRGSIQIPAGLTVLQAVAVDEEGGMSGIVEAIYNVD